MKQPSMITNLWKQNPEKQLTFYLKVDIVTVYNMPISLSSKTITRIEITILKMDFKDIPPFERLCHR